MTPKLLVLLPPSETKSDGGNRRFTTTLHWPELDPIRAEVRDALIELSVGSVERACAALKISPKLAETELQRNAQLADAPCKPAVERYTGVLYDAIDVASLDAAARTWMAEHVAIHSALYGLIGADDPIAAYRLSCTSKLPPVSLKQRWGSHISAVLAAHRGPILDLRSQGYVALGRLPGGAQQAWGDVRARMPDGSTRSLNHFNKHSKGRIIRLLAEGLAGGGEPESLEDLAQVLGDAVTFTRTKPGVLELVCEREL